MNAILSIIVCIAMLLSPAGTLPAQPETATTWTISDLTVEFGGETVTLAPEARVTAAAGMDEVQLHFELGSGDRTLLPMSGAINRDGVRFTLGTGMRTYTLNEETIMELTGMDAEDVQMLEVFGRFFVSYGNLFAAMKDAEKYAAYYDASWKLMEKMLGAEFAETEVEVDGEMLPGLQIEGGVTAAGMLDMVDAMGECGIPELEELMDAMLEMVSMVNGEPVEKFSDLAADMVEADDMDEVVMDMNCVYVTENPMYSKVDMTMDMNGQKMVTTAETLTRGENTVALMVMDMNAEGTAANFAVTMDYSGPITAPTRMNMAYDVRSESDFSYDYTEEDGSTRTYNSTDVTAMRMTLDSETVGGLRDMAAEVIVDNISVHGFDEDVDTYEETFNFGVDYSEQAEQDGSITGFCGLNAYVMDETAAVSFNINRAENDVVDYFAGTTEQPLSADTLDAGCSALMMDVMGVAADAMALTADESVMQLMAMFEGMAGNESVMQLMAMFEGMAGNDSYETAEDYGDYEDYTEDYEDYTEDYTEDYGDYEDYTGDYEDYTEDYTEDYGDYEDYTGDYEEYEEYTEEEEKVVHTFEEAAAVFEGTIPAYTAPEGYELKGITVDEYSLYAEYVSGDDEFELCTYAYNSDADYYSMGADGKLTAIEGMVVEMDTYGDEVGSATVYGDGCEVTFYFSGVDMATAEAIVNGLI